MKKIYIVIIAALFSTMTFAKTTKADRLFDRWDYSRAAKLYEKEATANPSADIYFKLGECYRKMNLYKEELAAYNKVNEKGVYKNPEFYLNYGQALKNTGKYDQAKVAFDKFTELMPTDPRGKFLSESIDIVSEDHHWDEPIAVTNVGSLNTTDAEFSPVVYKDGMVFASSRNTSGHGKIYGWTGKNYLDLFYAKKDTNNLSFKDIETFGEKVINKKYHNGPACFSTDYETVYITRVEKYLKGKQKKSLQIERNKIFVATQKDDKWTKPVPFFLNSDSFSVANPFITTDGLSIYFVSDMPGGFGETDIYYCNRMGETWSRPINMGSNINTANSEKFPNMAADGSFYFASDGYQGFGGLDICVALNKNGILQKAIPMKYPFNSFTDDFGIAFLKNGKTGYISSNRYEGGMGDDDIYYFDLSKENFITSVYTIGYRPDNLDVKFWINSPTNIPTERRVRETFPLRNYVFFNLGSTEIPDRYVLLTKNQVKDFKEDQLEVFKPVVWSARSKRQMNIYYNVMNILGDRMGKNPSSTITLVGSSEKGQEDGTAMSESVKKYLVSIFGIKASRIGIEGRYKPKLPSEQPGGVLELDLLREGDRRVSVESSTPALLLEFTSGPDAPLKPIEIVNVQEAPLDSYVSFNVEGSTKAFTSWALEIRDENGKVQNFGPYTQEEMSIPGKSILGGRLQGDYKVTMIGKTKSGKKITKEASTHLALWTPPDNEVGWRFSVIFEFNDSKAIDIYTKYLTEIVTPKIPKGGIVIIHGYTDIIGDEAYNLRLAIARANDVKAIIDKALSNSGRSDVKFEVRGFGENLNLSQFDNKFPEERFYNRTVIIDIFPGQKK